MARYAPLTRVEPLLAAGISVDYPNRPGILRDARFTVAEGEILGLIGRSGSGKSTIVLALMRLLELRGGSVRGSIRLDGRELMTAAPREMRRLRGKEMALVLQSPMSALNPALRLETRFREAWRAHSSEPWAAATPHIHDLLAEMDLPPEDAFLRRYPRELSVGQAQRVVIAMALLHGPRLLLADEPTSALDPESQDEVLDLFGRLRNRRNMAILYVSHDLASVEKLCDRVATVQDGRVVSCDSWAAAAGRPCL